MIGEREFERLETQATDGLDELDHLMLASSVPWRMPPAIGDLEAVNERNADRPGPRGRLAEKTRRAVDFEHWPAFYKSFVRLGRDDRPRRTAIPTDPRPSACSPGTCTTATPRAPSGRSKLRSRRARRCINW